MNFINRGNHFEDLLDCLELKSDVFANLLKLILFHEVSVDVLKLTNFNLESKTYSLIK